jgi:HK97 gp10 family phage protein
MGSVSVISHRKAVESAVEAAIARALEICGGKAESYAKLLCPVDTGRLRNSITHQAESDTVMAVGTNVEYAPYVELGTYKMAARPYLAPSVENHMSEYANIIQKELKKIG